MQLTLWNAAAVAKLQMQVENWSSVVASKE